MVIPKIHGRDKTNTAIILTKLAFLSPHPHKSCANAMIFWNTAMIVDNAANVINKKKNVPQTLPPAIALNTFGRVYKYQSRSFSRVYAKSKTGRENNQSRNNCNKGIQNCNTDSFSGQFSSFQYSFQKLQVHRFQGLK